MREIVRRQPGQSQIENLHHAAGGKQQVRRLQIAMHHAVLADVAQTPRHLHGDLTSISAAQRPHAAQQLRQINALDVLHRQEVMPLVLAGVGGPHHVRVVELTDGLHFDIKPPHEARLAAASERQQLKRHDALQIDVKRLIDCPHAAPADFFTQPERAQLRRRRVLLTIARRGFARASLRRRQLHLFSALCQQSYGAGVFVALATQRAARRRLPYRRRRRPTAGSPRSRGKRRDGRR